MTALKGALIILVAFGVIFSLRALPFLLMSRSAGDGKWFKIAENGSRPLSLHCS